MKRIVIIEDDKAILRGLADNLQAEHFHVETASDGESGYKLARSKPCDLIVLDIMLPGMDGFELTKRLRAEGVQTPILFLTGKKEEVDKVLGLEIGGDDYVTKPFSVRELIARIKAHLRREGAQKAKLEETIFGDVYVNFVNQEATKGKKALKMSAKEFALLKYFVEREGEVLSRDQILRDVWGFDVTPTSRTVDNYVLSLRKKVEKNPSEPEHILTIHTAGYKFVR
ncbi:MAG TPA: response regulator transcription factor [Bacteroidota bacterium]|nr:response regulator transcription factor [Bacteroidota bacterium]